MEKMRNYEETSGKGKTGLVMEGGGMRGLYTAGILDILMENGIETDGAIGVSAGAVFGCNYKSRQIGRPIRYNLAYSKDPRYMSFRSLIKTGDYFGADFCYRKLPNELDLFDVKTYAENPMDFYVVCTDVNTGRPVYHLANRGDDHDVQWMRASASMPFFAKAVELDGYELLDGGVSDSIPLVWFCGQGFTKNLVILTRPAGYRKQPSKFAPLMNLALRKRPALAHAMANRHVMYNEELDEVERQEKAGTAYVMRPDASMKISRTENDPEKLKAMYEYGRKEGERHLEGIRRFLKTK
ncbi:MAG: patatin family protein [Lachnospiraceae bacterium]|nr:patatin family protein [Lachnospiraceae bacterium]